MKYSTFKELFGWMVIIILVLSVVFSVPNAKAEEETFEIYPEMFVEDCKASSYNADTAARVFDFVTQPLESNPKLDSYSAFCGCLSDKFFDEAESQSYNEAANNYEWYNMFIERGNSAPAFIKSSQYSSVDGIRIRSNIRACKTQVEKGKKDAVSQTIPKDISSWSSSIVQGYKSLPSWVEGSAMMEKKAVGLAQCMESKLLESKQSSSVVEMARKEVVEVIRADGNWAIAQNVEARTLAIKAIDECY